MRERWVMRLKPQPDPVVLRWWEMMEPYMECNPDGSPRQEPVEEMFHAD
jgi:L-rhamnose mutarotase